jgi:hypothetical protein
VNEGANTVFARAAPVVAWGAVVAIIIGLLGLARDYGGLSARVDVIERAIPLAQASAIKLAGIEAKMESVADSLIEIKRGLDQDRRPYPPTAAPNR